MELHQLRYFAKVAELGQFTRAAEACGVSQPSLSQAIAKLEVEVGKPLFERLGRGVRLTEAGVKLRACTARLWARSRPARWPSPGARGGITPRCSAGSWRR